MFFVYVLKNTRGLQYIGHTADLKRRLDQHNSPDGHMHLGKYTHRNGPWELLESETYASRAEAMQREKQLKSWKSPKKVRALFEPDR
jgi:tRNA/rRNA methyltransferase